MTTWQRFSSRQATLCGPLTFLTSVTCLMFQPPPMFPAVRKAFCEQQMTHARDSIKLGHAHPHLTQSAFCQLELSDEAFASSSLQVLKTKDSSSIILLQRKDLLTHFMGRAR